MAVFTANANTRLHQKQHPPGGDTPWLQGRNPGDTKRVGTRLQLHSADNHFMNPTDLNIVTRSQPSAHTLHRWASPPISRLARHGSSSTRATC